MPAVLAAVFLVGTLQMASSAKVSAYTDILKVQAGYLGYDPADKGTYTVSDFYDYYGGELAYGIYTVMDGGHFARYAEGEGIFLEDLCYLANLDPYSVDYFRFSAFDGHNAGVSYSANSLLFTQRYAFMELGEYYNHLYGFTDYGIVADNPTPVWTMLAVNSYFERWADETSFEEWRVRYNMNPAGRFRLLMGQDTPTTATGSDSIQGVEVVTATYEGWPDLEADDVDFKIGENNQLQVWIENCDPDLSDFFLGRLEYQSLNPDIVDVDATGKLTAKAEGDAEVKIYVSVTDNTVDTYYKWNPPVNKTIHVHVGDTQNDDGGGDGTGTGTGEGDGDGSGTGSGSGPEDGSGDNGGSGTDDSGDGNDNGGTGGDSGNGSANEDNHNPNQGSDDQQGGSPDGEAKPSDGTGDNASTDNGQGGNRDNEEEEKPPAGGGNTPGSSGGNGNQGGNISGGSGNSENTPGGSSGAGNSPGSLSGGNASGNSGSGNTGSGSGPQGSSGSANAATGANGANSQGTGENQNVVQRPGESNRPTYINPAATGNQTNAPTAAQAAEGRPESAPQSEQQSAPQSEQQSDAESLEAESAETESAEDETFAVTSLSQGESLKVRRVYRSDVDSDLGSIGDAAAIGGGYEGGSNPLEIALVNDITKLVLLLLVLGLLAAGMVSMYIRYRTEFDKKESGETIA